MRRLMLMLILLIGLARPVSAQVQPDDVLAGKPPFRRLFLDAMVVEQSQGLTRVFHSAEKYTGNPIIAKDKDWEGWGPYQYGTVMWDAGKLKMWYQCIGGDAGGYVCYAESHDGIRWTKPELGIFGYKGSKANNIVQENDQFHIPSVMKLADGKWAMYGFGRSEGAGPHVGFSDDGLHWKLREGDPRLFDSSDVTNYFHDPYRNRYVCTYKTPNRRHRAVGVALSDDGLTWHKPMEGAIFGADDLDPDDMQIYGMPVFPYQGMYIGLPWMYHSRFIKYGGYTPDRMYEAQEGSPCTMDVQFTWSWNLVQWNRTPDRKPFIALGPKGSFDSEMITTARAPIVMGDKLYFYYGGFDKKHDVYKDVHGAIGLATLRLDGFCSMHAGLVEGWFISRREVFRTPRVSINAKCAPGGYVIAELLDRNDDVIPGFSKAECIPFKGDSTHYLMRWKTAEFSGKIADSDKKVRFFLKDADLYSYLPMDIDQAKDDGMIWMER